VLAFSGCGDVRVTFGDPGCGHHGQPGIVVEFFAVADGSPVAVAATGTLTDGPYVERMVPAGSRPVVPGRTYALAGAFGRDGIYDVRVETGSGEVLTWRAIRVVSDRCGPFTVYLRGEVRVP
jgi:hypothetical protein